MGPRDPNSFGTDEFIALCREAGAERLINVNLATGTPGEAADWVRYCAGRVRWWGVGNEQYGFSGPGPLQASRLCPALP